MRRRYLIGLILAIVAIGATAGGITVSAVTGGNGGNASGPEADAAAAAALGMFEGSTLLEVEHADDAGAVWEVELRKADGEELEVLLDGNLNQVGVFPNDDADEGPDDDDGNEGPDDDDADGSDDDDRPQG